MNWHFVRQRWLELRMGYSSYLAYLVAFVNLMLLISLRFTFLSTWGYGYGTLIASVFVLGALSSVALVLGNLHLRWQQRTDARLEYQWVVDELILRMKKEHLFVREDKPIEAR